MKLFPILTAAALAAATPAHAGGCKFVGAYALTCSDGNGGSVNLFFNGEKWSQPVFVPAPPVQYRYRPVYVQAAPAYPYLFDIRGRRTYFH